MSYANCLEGYLTEGCKTCPDWLNGTEGRGIGCGTNKPIDECPHFHAMWERDNKKHRLDVLKEERDQVKNMKCLSFDVRDQAIKYYDHEIMCIEEYGSDNPIID